MALLKDMLTSATHGASVAGGALATRVVSTTLGGPDGYKVGGKVPFSPVAAVSFYTLSSLSKRLRVPLLSSILKSAGDGAFATWGDGVGYKLATDGLSLDALTGTGNNPHARYANRFEMADKHAKKAG